LIFATAAHKLRVVNVESRIRPVIFWSHLVAGVAAGLIILLMSVTGVLLTYERQIIDWAEQSLLTESAAEREVLTAEELLLVARHTAPDAGQVTITLRQDPASIVKISAGRDLDLLVDPYTGMVLHEGPTSTETFFRNVMYLHRWLLLSGDQRATGRAITGYSNLLFLFLLASGTYLWLPRIWKWAIVKTRIFFNPKAKTGKARDFNWHHVFAFWAVIPLFFLITTASVFYFSWANEWVYGAYGEDPPERRRANVSADMPVRSGEMLSVDEMLLIAQQELDTRGLSDWESISMRIAPDLGAPASFRIDRSIGGQPAMVYNMTLDGADGTVTDWRTFADSSPGSRARSNIRFLHTGEVFGFAGQTIAGLASVAGSVLAYTGLALAWRRLILPLFRRRRIRMSTTNAA